MTSTVPPVRRGKPRLGEILVSLGYLRADQLEAVSQHQRELGLSFGRAAIAQGLCTEAQVVAALARQTGLRTIELDRVEAQAPEVQGLVPLKAAQEHRAVVLKIDRGVLLMAMAAPASVASQDALRTMVGKSRCEVLLASDEAVERAISRFYGVPQFAPSPPAPPPRAPVPRPPFAPGLPRVSAPTHEPPASLDGEALLKGVVIPRPELFDTLGLSARAAEVVQRIARENQLSYREVIARVLESWAATQSRGPQR